MEIVRKGTKSLKLSEISNGEVFEYMSYLYMKTYPRNGGITYVVNLSDGEIIGSMDSQTKVKPFKCKLVEDNL